MEIDNMITTDGAAKQEAPVMDSAPEPMPIDVPAHDGGSHDSEVQEEQSQEFQNQPEEAVEAHQEEEPQVAETDPYGNSVDTTEKTYTQSQVNAMMQERLQRQAQSFQNQAVEPQQQQQAYQPEAQVGQDDWEVQLDNIIDQRLSSRQAEAAAQQKAQQEVQQAQAHQDKFLSGAQRYTDFQDVVTNNGVNVTEGMYNASRTLEDPSGFFYAAAKQSPEELNRISQINDPMRVAAEMARLDERMRKPAKSKSSAPPPVRHERGDLAHKSGSSHSQSIDAMITAHGQERIRKRSGR